MALEIARFGQWVTGYGEGTGCWGWNFELGFGVAVQGDGWPWRREDGDVGGVHVDLMTNICCSQTVWLDTAREGRRRRQTCTIHLCK